MATADLLPKTSEAERVLNWRLEELQRAGFDRTTAWELAERTDVDLHLAVALGRSGCPGETALQILL